LDGGGSPSHGQGVLRLFFTAAERWPLTSRLLALRALATRVKSRCRCPSDSSLRTQLLPFCTAATYLLERAVRSRGGDGTLGVVLDFSRAAGKLSTDAC
jgi:hypothetical protein